MFRDLLTFNCILKLDFVPNLMVFLTSNISNTINFVSAINKKWKFRKEILHIFWRMENPPALSEPNLLLQGTFEIQVRFLARWPLRKNYHCSIFCKKGIQSLKGYLLWQFMYLDLLLRTGRKIRSPKRDLMQFLHFLDSM